MTLLEDLLRASSIFIHASGVRVDEGIARLLNVESDHAVLPRYDEEDSVDGVDECQLASIREVGVWPDVNHTEDRV